MKMNLLQESLMSENKEDTVERVPTKRLGTLHSVLFVVIAMLMGGVGLRAAELPADDDTLFKALNDEMKRSLSLRLEDLDKPYFIQLEVEDAVTHRIGASYGSLEQSAKSHSRILHSQLRVGTYDQDNSNFAGGRGGGRRGLSLSVELPVDDSYLALRQAIWRATDVQYKDAAETLAQKRAYLKERNVEERPKDFTQMKSVTVLKERAVLKFDTKRWEENIRRIASKFSGYKHIQNSDVSLVAGAETHYMLNSEGSKLRIGETGAVLRITAEAQADDGERLSDHIAYCAGSPETLPSLNEIFADVTKMVDGLAAAMKAPILEDYTGPVLIDGIASPMLFRQILARGVTAQSDPLGVARRNQGVDDLESRLGKRILPVTFQIYDDPRNETFQNTFLTGYYSYDDEGVVPQRVNIVVDGKMEGMLTSRTPTKQFPVSNGHGRRTAGDIPRAAVGCMFVESTKSESAAELKKELLDAADSDGLKFGIRVSSIQTRASGGGGVRGRGGRGALAGGFTRTVGDPIAIYKVYVSDGHEEPVRGCEFNSVDLRSLRKILAAGNTYTVHNSTGGSSPASSVIAPAVLFEELELSRIKRETEKKPLIDPPHARNP